MSDAARLGQAAAFSPRSLDEALAHLAERPELLPAAGCTDLMVGPPGHSLALPAVLDLLRIPELRGVRRLEDGRLEIGATTSFSEIRRSPEIERHYPILAEAAAVVGGWQVQNRATVGGNLVNASPAGDSLPALLALEATVVLARRDGRREIPYTAFHRAYRQTALEPGELLAAIRLPPLPAGSRQLYRKVGTREAQAISKVVVALVVRLEGGHLADVRLAAGSVAPTPLRLTAVEEALTGQPAGPETAELAARLATESVQPIDDVRSTARYRRHVLGRVVRRLMLATLANSLLQGSAGAPLT